MERETFHGYWWNESEEEAVAGIANYEPQERHLRLFGTLTKADVESEQAAPIHTSLDHLSDGFVLGETTDADLVTLVDASPTNLSNPSMMSDKGYPSSEYRFRRAYKGGHFHEEPEFDSIILGFDGLVEWFNESRIKIGLSEELDDETQARFEVSPPTSSEIQVKDATIIFSANSSNSTTPKIVEIENKASIKIIPNDPSIFPQLDEEYVRPIQRYLAFATGTPVQPTYILGSVGENWRDATKSNLPPELNQIDILSSIPQHVPEDRTVEYSSILFERAHVDLEESLNYWLESEEKAEYLFNFYFSVVYNNNLNAEHKFQSLAVGLESYFSHIYPDYTVMDPAEYVGLREDISKELPNGTDIEERVNNLLGSIGNSPSYRDKLELIVDSEKSILSSIMDVDETLKTATDIRHDLAHGLGRDYSLEEMVETMRKLEIIIECLLLTIAGVHDDDKEEIFQRKYSGYEFLDT